MKGGWVDDKEWVVDGVRLDQRVVLACLSSKSMTWETLKSTTLFISLTRSLELFTSCGSHVCVAEPREKTNNNIARLYSTVTTPFNCFQ